MVRPEWNACRLAGLCLCIIRAHATLRRRRLRHRGGAHIAIGCAPDSCLIGLRLGLFATPPSHFGHSGGCSGSHVPASFALPKRWTAEAGRDQRPGGLPGFSLPTGDPTSSPVIHTAVTQSRSLLERTPLKCGSVPEATADAPALMDIPDLQDEPPRKRTEASSASKPTRRIRISSARWSPVWWRCSMSSTTGRNLRSGAS